MEFIKFPSLTNHYENFNRVVSANPELHNTKFIITEKLDGSNFQIIIGKDDVKFATRNRMLEVTDSFFDWQNVVLVGRSTEIDKVQGYISSREMCIKTVHIYGELFGSGVQKRINYCGEGVKDFRAFEVMIDGEPLSIKDAHEFLTKCGIDIEDFCVPTIGFATGINNALSFESQISSRFCEHELEGVVLAPYDTVIKTIHKAEGEEDTFSLLRIKKKNKAFNDKMSVGHKAPKLAFVGSEAFDKMMEIWGGYFNENRLADMFSKEGNITSSKEIGKYIQLLMNDARTDFLKSHKEPFIALRDDERKQLMSSGSKFIVPLLQKALQEN